MKESVYILSIYKYKSVKMIMIIRAWKDENQKRS